MLPTSVTGLFLALAFLFCDGVHGFSMTMMARRGKGDLRRSLDDTSMSQKKGGVNSLNQGKGQEITGVTLPAEGKLKGWEFGDGVRMVAANVDGSFYALQGDCPRCAFDLWKGDLITRDPGFDDLPCVACPTCATTFSVRTGKYGPPLKRKGLQGFITGLAKTATQNDAKDAKAFQITRDEDGKVFCR